MDRSHRAYEKEKGNNKVKALEGENQEIKKVYDLTAVDGQTVESANRYPQLRHIA